VLAPRLRGEVLHLGKVSGLSDPRILREVELQRPVRAPCSLHGSQHFVEFIALRPRSWDEVPFSKLAGASTEKVDA
jgi:hypothetical protein